jgi:diguanylate cyclase (GGDEF)-like protein/PAS domain S-box-containing protein
MPCPVLLLTDSPSTWPDSLTGGGEPWPLSAVAGGEEACAMSLASRLAEPGGLLLLDVADAGQAEAALSRLDLPQRAPGALWIALMPARPEEPRGRLDAEHWWACGAFDAVAADDEAAVRRAVRRARAWAASAAAIPAQLRAARAQVHAMQASLDNIPAPIFAKDAAGLYTGCNQAFVDYLGLPRGQIIGRTVFDVAPPPLAAVYDEADRKLLAGGGRQVYEAQVRWADGSLRDVIFHKAVFHDSQGQVAGQAGAIFDITDRKRLEHGLRELAQTDPLTGLLNRRCFIERASAALQAARDIGTPVAMLVFDIDHFKPINDTEGHAGGDAILCHLAQLARGQLRGDDVLARIGGDEFACLLIGPGDARAVAARLPALVAATPLDYEGRPLGCAISVGVAVVSPRDHDVDSALRLADAALYEAKRQGRNRAVVFDSAL